jgi:hypothetical protein
MARKVRVEYPGAIYHRHFAKAGRDVTRCPRKARKASVPQIRRFFALTIFADPRSRARMVRKLRVEYPGAIYHVMNRGDRRAPIFKDDLDRQRFLATLGKASAKTGWQVHAYCLMENHFHLVVETPLANLVVGMKWFLGTFTSSEELLMLD